MSRQFFGEVLENFLLLISKVATLSQIPAEVIEHPLWLGMVVVDHLPGPPTDGAEWLNSRASGAPEVGHVPAENPLAPTLQQSSGFRPATVVAEYRQQIPTLHPGHVILRSLDSGHLEQGRKMVMTDHGQIGTTPRFDHSRPSHHQRNSRAALQRRTLAAT